jgi:hypothetical protein
MIALIEYADRELRAQSGKRDVERLLPSALALADRLRVGILDLLCRNSVLAPFGGLWARLGLVQHIVCGLAGGLSCG